MFDTSAQSRTSRVCWISAALLGAALLAACNKQPVVPAPTQRPPGLAVDLNATAAALDAAVTQVANSQATLVAEARDLSATEAVQATRSAAALPAAAPGTQAQATGVAPTPTTAALSPVPTPAPTAAATPVPLATPAPEPTLTAHPTSSAACTSVHPALAPILEAARAAGMDPGCPVAAAASVQGAVQEYWANVQNPDPGTHLRSLLLWRGDTSEIYVLRGADTEARQGGFAVYTDRWQEGDPAVAPACAALPVPAGYQMPVRGFGRPWCNDGLASVVGWPNRQEVGAVLLAQPARNGVLLQVSAPDAGLGYLVALDYASGRVLTRVATP